MIRDWYCVPMPTPIWSCCCIWSICVLPASVTSLTLTESSAEKRCVRRIGAAAVSASQLKLALLAQRRRALSPNVRARAANNGEPVTVLRGGLYSALIGLVSGRAFLGLELRHSSRARPLSVSLGDVGLRLGLGATLHVAAVT